ncbi:thermonuclease family protein [Pseudorhodoplanes sp.]|uniref:thermonuclease family protein n=1 Tax=Pseudorhodoplanes sp. TaxID=1934341 RepID=UPI003D126D66
MMGEHGGPVLAIAAATLLALLSLGSPARACGAEALGEGHVAAISDSRTLLLSDGRSIRLAGIEWAVPPATARAHLARLLGNRTVTLRGVPAEDRYRRIHAFPSVSGSETPIQYSLLDQGLAVTGVRIGDPACREKLLRRERAARAARLGIWGSGDYRLHQADDPVAILQDRGRFAIVEGRVLSVRESGSTTYVNFGRRWSEDFTVTIARRSLQAFAGLPPKSLAGRTVRVRGVIEERAGPWIEAVSADQFDWDGQR